MSSIGFQQTGHEQYAGPGHWNDTDMLVVGKLGLGTGRRAAADTAHAGRAVHAHLALGAAGGAAADRRGSVTAGRLHARPARQSRGPRHRSGSARQGGAPRVERRLDGGLGAAAGGRTRRRRPVQPRPRCGADDGESCAMWVAGRRPPFICRGRTSTMPLRGHIPPPSRGMASCCSRSRRGSNDPADLREPRTNRGRATSRRPRPRPARGPRWSPRC